MKVMIFGATGMVGSCALNQCLANDEIEEVLVISRKLTNMRNEKLKEIILDDVADLSSIENEIIGYDGCYFCLGVSSVGMKEDSYTQITYDLTMKIAEKLVKLNDNMTFIYVSGGGTDSTEKGKTMWARVKGKTENDLLKLGFKDAYMFRIGAIIPKNGEKSKVKLYNFLNVVLKPFYPILIKSKIVITSEQIGNAMIFLTRNGFEKTVLQNHEIKEIVSR